jgi:ATP-dependent Clp protease ATP-binding subunit ClpA
VATPAAVEELGKQGFDPDMGARPLRRIIQQKIEDALSDAMLAGEYEDGDTIVVDVDGEEIKLRRATEDEIAPPAEPVVASETA